MRTPLVAREVIAEHVASPESAEVLAALTDLIGVLQRTRRAHQQDAPSRAVLIALAKGGPQRVCDIAQVMQLDQSTVSRHIAHLADRGLVARSTDPTDRRAQRLDLTPEGEAEARAALAVRFTELARVIDDWSDADRQTFAHLLTTFTTGFRNQIGEGAPR